MKTTLRKLVITLAAVTALMFMFCTVSAADDNPSGALSSTVNWELEKHVEYGETTYTLKITGTGAIPNLQNKQPQEWKNNSELIVDIVIGDGITGIGDYAFYGIASSGTIGKDVTYIGNHAFDSSNTDYGYTPYVFKGNKVKTIGDYAFGGCYDEDCKLVIPDGVETIGSHAFANFNEDAIIVLPASVKTIKSYFVGGNTVYSVKYKGTKSQLAKVNVAASGNSKLLAKKVTCSNGKSYFTANVNSAKIKCSSKLTYNGKNRKPTVTIKNAAGTNLKKNTDYTVTYAKKCKKPGHYKVTIKGKGKYTGTVKVKYNVVPKAIKWYRTYKSMENTTYVEWKTWKHVTGCTIQWSKTKSFKKKKSYTSQINICGFGSFKGIKRGQTFYIRIRNITNPSSGMPVYSKWKYKKLRL